MASRVTNGWSFSTFWPGLTNTLVTLQGMGDSTLEASDFCNPMNSGCLKDRSPLSDWQQEEFVSHTSGGGYVENQCDVTPENT